MRPTATPAARGFLKMKELKENGARVVGMFCSFVPTELVYAAGALPVGLCAFTDEPIPAAEAHLPRNLCPLIKASYGFALTDTCPYFYFSDLVVGETTCDGKKKMFELLDEIKETYVMQLPHSRDERSLAFWRGEIVPSRRSWRTFSAFRSRRRPFARPSAGRTGSARSCAATWSWGSWTRHL